MKKVVWSGVVLMTCLAVTGTAMAADGVQKPRQRVQQRLDKQFKALDANHDGGISRDEWKGRAKAFDRLDANHDNVLNLQELQRGMAKVAKARRRR
jgi:Ca2+-binding EF-hand superfamily protein